MELLDQIITSQDAIVQQSQHQDSLTFTINHNNTNQGLTHITDPAFKFFTTVDKVRVSLQTKRLVDGNKRAQCVVENIIVHPELKEHFHKLFEWSQNEVTIIEELYTAIITLYLSRQ